MGVVAGLAAALPGCGAIVEGDTRFCGDCWTQLEFLDDQGCSACNLPLPGGEDMCARCLAAPPRHGRVHAAVAYGEVARKVVLRLKYGRRPGVARIIAASMGRDIPSGPTVLLVPCRCIDGDYGRADIIRRWKSPGMSGAAMGFRSE